MQQSMQQGLEQKWDLPSDGGEMERLQRTDVKLQPIWREAENVTPDINRIHFCVVNQYLYRIVVNYSWSLRHPYVLTTSNTSGEDEDPEKAI